MQAYDLGVNIKSKYLALIQVFSSITVLVYSLLIAKNDYSSLSEKMYACASRLSELKRKIYPHLENGTIELYNAFNDEYLSILKLFETATINDFRADYFRAQLDMPKFYKFDRSNKISLLLKIAVLYTLNYLQYMITFVVLSGLLYWLWLGPQATK